ncbi:MAG: sialidase family protein [Oscillospiraceae bacterium]|nr:sialidase family protein [Oscillospiraceae bacterium]
MRILEKILCFVLVLTILLIPACSGSAKKKQSETGRYQEKDISPPIEGQFSSFVTADDRIICFDFGLRNRYESHDMGETWQESMGPGADTNRYEFVSSLSLLNDDSLVVFIPDEGLRIIMQDGTEQEIIISDIDNAITSGQATTVTLL